jgi:hypothetical protein
MAAGQMWHTEEETPVELATGKLELMMIMT